MLSFFNNFNPFRSFTSTPNMPIDNNHFDTCQNLFNESKFTEAKQFAIDNKVSIKGIVNFHTDVALEEGRIDDLRKLHSLFGARHSLYAEQMAEINCHHNTMTYAQSFMKKRNDTSIHAVHRHYNHKTKEFTYDDIVPPSHRILSNL